MIENRRWDPLTGIVSATTKTRSDMLQSAGEMLYNPYQKLVKSRSPIPSHPRNTTNVSTHTQTSIPPSHLSSDRQDAERGKDPLVVAGNMAGATLKENLANLLVHISQGKSSISHMQLQRASAKCIDCMGRSLKTMARCEIGNRVR